MKSDKETIKNMAKIIIPLIVVITIFLGAMAAGIITIGTLEKNKEEVTAIIYLDYGGGDIQSYEITSINNTVYGFLIEAANEGGFDIQTTYYGQYDSTLVDSIGSYIGGQDDKYWQYYLNGEYGMIGADIQTVNNGDIIEWRFEGFEY